MTLSQSISDTSARRAHWIAAAGWVIIMLAAGAVALPLIGPTQGALVIGAMLLVAGLIEASAALFRAPAQ